MITTVTGKNQITIPAKLADQLDIRVGTRIEWSVGGEGILIARLLPGRADLARKASGMGRSWISEGEDPIGELVREREKSDSEEDPV